VRIISLAFSDLNFSGWVELINFIYYELMKKMLACVMSTVFFVNTIALVMLTGMGVASAASKDSYAATKYPIIFEPGFGGVDKLFVFIDYFYRIPEDLRAHGANVYLSTSSAFQRPDGPNGRGEQLLAYVKAVLAITGAEKVNLIGYSQGGLTVRYVAAVAPDLVASLTTIGTPHHGSELADYFEELLNKNPIRPLSTALGGLSNAFASITTANLNQDMFAALKSLTTSQVVIFNENYPSAGLDKLASCKGGAEFETFGSHRQYLYSWGGAAIKEKESLFGTNVIDTSVIPFIDLANFVDPTTKALYRFGRVMINRGSGSNDGMVSTCSSMFGKVISNNFNWNHFDEINQVLGIRGAYAEDPLAVIRTHVNRLKMQGL
jgi:triacylglycerol lipase